jgi:uncharacterized protein (DUF3084 family)
MLAISSSVLFVSCSGDALKQAQTEQVKLQQEVDAVTQQAAEVQAKITTLERQYPQFGAIKAMAAKENETLAAATAYLQTSIGVVETSVKETNDKAARYRTKYLTP